MKNNLLGSEVIRLFASACEELNEFSRDLYDIPPFGRSWPTADIRLQPSGWLLEKHVEAALSFDNSLIAAWSLELSEVESKWTVSSSVNVSHSNVFFDLQKEVATSLVDLQSILENAIATLRATLGKSDSFYLAILDLQKSNRGN